ncbi:MAG TPA: ACT domain-containing protein [Candidatus Thermoplasmatota archaeon]|nr:ACT domain-containing protein [Candidatus Thermoplasmatota archaeon]
MPPRKAPAAAPAPPQRSTAQSVRQYIDAHPVVRDALALDIVNLSALTRRIMKETGLPGEEAVLVACRRYQPVQRADYQAAIRRVLDKSKLEVRTRVAVLTAHPSWRLFGKLEKAMNALAGRSHPIHVLHGSESITIITDETLLEEMEEILGSEEIVKKRAGLVELNIRSPDSIEDVPGILAFLASSLAGRGINFVEVISCYKDNMFLIEEADLFKAFEVLNGLIRT